MGHANHSGWLFFFYLAQIAFRTNMIMNRYYIYILMSHTSFPIWFYPNLSTWICVKCSVGGNVRNKTLFGLNKA